MLCWLVDYKLSKLYDFVVGIICFCVFCFDIKLRFSAHLISNIMSFRQVLYFSSCLSLFFYICVFYLPQLLVAFYVILMPFLYVVDYSILLVDCFS